MVQPAHVVNLQDAEKTKAKEDLQFFNDLETRLISLHIDVNGDLKLQQRLIHQFLCGFHPTPTNCVVCIKIDKKVLEELL